VLTKARLRSVSAMDYYTAWADTTGVEGRWHTRSAAFGLNDGDVVSRGHLRKILTGSGARQRVNRHPGFDLTFSCPKSVSLVAFGHPDQYIREAVTADHEESVKAALDWLENHALVTRQTTDGVTNEVPVQGIYAMFQHNTSRLGDPQLHIHVLLPNLGVRPDGKLVAIDRHVLNQWKVSVDTIYRLEFRARLGERGLTFNPASKHGLADLDGMPRELILEYSKRRKEIEESFAKKEADGDTVTSGDRRRIAVKTRAKKLEGRKAAESEDVGPLLRQDLEDSGRDLSFWSEMQKEKRTPPVVDKSLATSLTTVLLGEGGALSSKASWSRPDLLRALATVLPAGLFAAQVDDLADLIERDERIIPLVYVNTVNERTRRGETGLHLVRATRRHFEVPSSLGLRFTSRSLLPGVLFRPFSVGFRFPGIALSGLVTWLIFVPVRRFSCSVIIRRSTSLLTVSMVAIGRVIRTSCRMAFPLRVGGGVVGVVGPTGWLSMSVPLSFVNSAGCCVVGVGLVVLGLVVRMAVSRGCGLMPGVLVLVCSNRF